MIKWVKNSKKGMAVLGAVGFMLVAGWQVGIGWNNNLSHPQDQLNEKIQALDLAFAGSGSAKCYAGIGTSHIIHVPRCETGCPYEWYSDALEIGTCSN
jgi:hypothetical protein